MENEDYVCLALDLLQKAVHSLTAAKLAFKEEVVTPAEDGRAEWRAGGTD